MIISNALVKGKLVNITVNGDGVINAKDYAYIYRMTK